MATHFSTCRFCDNWRDQGMVKYGTRHYAHFKCYLDAGKKLDDLHPWQVGLFPHFLLKERGLLDHPKCEEAYREFRKLEEYTYSGGSR